MSDLSDALTNVTFDLDEITKAVNASYASARGEDLVPVDPSTGKFNFDGSPHDSSQVGGQHGESGEVPLPLSGGTSSDEPVTPTPAPPAEPPASGTSVDETFNPPVPTTPSDHVDGFLIAEVAAQASGGGGGPDGSSVSPPPGTTPTSTSTSTSTPTPTPTPVEQVFSLDEMARAAYGQLDPTQAAAMFDLYDRVAQMPPHLQNAVIAAVGGDIDSAVAQLAPYARTPVAQPAAPAPAPARSRDPLYGDDDEYATLPPEVQARIDALEAQQQQFLAQQQDQYLASITQQATLGLHDFAEKYSRALTPGEIAGLQHAVNQASQFVDTRARARGGDYRGAYYEAMETHLYANPSLREKVISVEQATATSAPTTAAEATRQQRAASVATNTGNANAPGTPTPSPSGSPLAAMPGAGAGPGSLPTNRPPTQAEMIAAAAKMIPQT